MIPVAPPYEIEVKLRFGDLAVFARAGISLELETARHFEDNWLLDSTDCHLGPFVELEGEEEVIARAVELLGVTPEEYAPESYLAIQAESCRRRGKPLEDMTFA